MYVDNSTPTTVITLKLSLTDCAIVSGLLHEAAHKYTRCRVDNDFGYTHYTGAYEPMLASTYEFKLACAIESAIDEQTA